MTDLPRMRLDLWLFRIRLFKTRGAAAEAIARDGVRIEREGWVRRAEKPSTEVSPGDMLNLSSPSGRRLVRILALPDRRGPAAEARGCYETVDAVNAGRTPADEAAGKEDGQA